MSICPVLIETMMVCYYAAFPESILQKNSSVDKALRELKSSGLIDETGTATDRGRVWVEAICATPLPTLTQTWTVVRS